MFSHPTLVVIILDLAAIVLVFGAIIVFARRVKRSVVKHWRCGQCSYDLRGHISDDAKLDGRCPECGTSFSDISPVAPGKPHQRLANRYWRTGLLAFVAIWTIRVAYELLSFFSGTEVYWTDWAELGLEVLGLVVMLGVWWQARDGSSRA